MPEMGGYEATSFMRKAEDTYGIPFDSRHFICGFSANVSSEIQRKSHEAGMNKILSKPMSADVLESMINEHKRDSNTFTREQHNS